ncbi:MAG TPA: TonB-dependent receptor [Terriglobales bacterium]|nr:TonB-dependent receptor [Terriglobales bacterium]
MNATTMMRLLCAAVLFSLVPCMAFAQGVATGDLHVSVKDPKGSLINGATVTVRDVAKGLERAGTGDGQGGYSVRLLPPGVYSVTVEAPGFTKTEATGVSITVGQMAELPVAVTIASGKEVVEVSSEATLVETSRSSSTETIGQRRIDNLPINGRNYINFTLTDSRIVRDNAPNTGAAPTSGLNMSGQRARSNLVNVDGADATDNSVNGVRSTVSQEAVQEFQIITNNYEPEYGRASGGVVNIITRSGSNDFHGDVFGFLRNRKFQAVNPFSTVSDPAYTRVQGGVAFGGPIKKDKTYYYFSFETTRRHETGFSSIGQDNFGLSPYDASAFLGLPPTAFVIQATPDQVAFLNDSSPGDPGLAQYVVLVGRSSGMALDGVWPGPPAFGGGASGFTTSCQVPPCFVPLSYQTLNSQRGNFPVFEGTSVYSLRLDHNLNNNNRLSLRVGVSPSTITGIEVGGQDQPFGQNAYSRTSRQTFRDINGIVQETATLGTNKVNEFMFQFARRGLSYFFNTDTPGGSDPAVNIPGFAYFGREPYSYIQRTEKRYQFRDTFSWTIGRHDTKFGGDFNYLPLDATFTVNYGGVYDFGQFSVAPFGLPGPPLSAVQAYGAGLPGTFVQGLGSPHDSFSNKPLGLFWQDSWHMRHNLTLNFGVRYDVEFPPQFKKPTDLAEVGYNFLGLQKGIETDKNNFQPRIGVAWDPHGDGKTVVRASYGLFYDHPLLGLYFLGDASDGSTSGQLAFGGTGICGGFGNPGNLNAIPIFQGLPINVADPANPCAASTSQAVADALGYLPNQQQFTSLNFPQSAFLNQNYLTTTPLPLGFQPFGYPQGKNFVYAYSQQANFSIERDLGKGFALNLAYNFNGGRHLNRPINANTVRGDLLTQNFVTAVSLDGQSFSSPFAMSFCSAPGHPLWVDPAILNFFRRSGLNPSIVGFYHAIGRDDCIGKAEQILQGLGSQGFNTACDPSTLANCVPFGDMDANFSNGSSVYHSFSANLRKRFSGHYEFLASYTWSHAIDDSVDLQSTTTPQDSFFPGHDRSTSLFDQRHRFVFSGVYQSGKLSGDGFASKFFSNWTVAPLVEFSSGRPFNIITGSGDNFQLSSLTGRPNTTVDPTCGPASESKYSPSGTLQQPCINSFVLTGTFPTLVQLDGNLGRNRGITPWTVFNDLRIAKRIYFNERFNMELIADMFNLANRYNVSAVSPLFSNAGQATAAYDPRQFQFAVKLNW